MNAAGATAAAARAALDATGWLVTYCATLLLAGKNADATEDTRPEKPPATLLMGAVKTAAGVTLRPSWSCVITLRSGLRPVKTLATVLPTTLVLVLGLAKKTLALVNARLKPMCKRRA